MFKCKLGNLQIVMWQIILLITAVYVIHLTAECNVCQSNEAACINSSSYYLCFGDEEPNKSILYHCKDGFDCTDLNAICVQTSSQRPPSCGDTSLCGMCSAHRNYLFACHSRTTFQMCYGAIRPTGQIGSCPSNYVCHGASDAVCVPEEMVENVTCDIVDNSGGITSTSTSSPLMNSTTKKPEHKMLTPNEVCEQQRSVGLYPAIPNDSHCRRYISCLYFNGIMKGIEYNCILGTYFHIQHQKCGFNKPTYCM